MSINPPGTGPSPEDPDDDVVRHPLGPGHRDDEPAGATAAGAEPDADPRAVAPPEPTAEVDVPPPAVPPPAETEPDVEPVPVSAADPTPEPTPTEEQPSAAAPVGPRRRTRDPLAGALIGVLTLLLGFAFAVQVRSVGADAEYSSAREEDLVRILDDLNAREERLRDQISDQRSALEQLSNSDSQLATALQEARTRAEAIGILNGTLPARGPGLTMTIHDPDAGVGVADVLDAIQELRGAGAETMQIDGVRVGVSTAVTGKPGNLMIDGHPISEPYEVLVIGSAQDMETALNIPGGVVPRINSRGGSVDITPSDAVVVDALRPLDTPQYAEPDTGD